VNLSIIGGMGSGKTTIAQHFVQNYDYTAFSFAEEVKMIAVMILKRPIDKGIDRPFLQNIGEWLKMPYEQLTDSIKSQIISWINYSNDFKEYWEKNKNKVFHPCYYVDKIVENDNFKRAVDKRKAIFHDQRFLVEESALDYFSFKTVYLDVPLNIRISRMIERDSNFKEDWLSNSSEQQIIQLKRDYEVQNAHNLSISEIADLILQNLFVMKS